MRRYRLSSYIGVISLFISVSALALAVWQGILQRENFHKSVQPSISVVPTISNKERLVGLYLFNSGTGPGYLDKITIRYNGKTISGNTPTTGFKELANALNINLDCIMIAYPRPGDPVMLNEMTPLLAVGTLSDPECLATEIQVDTFIRYNTALIDISVTYHSLYGDMFVYQLSSNRNSVL